MNISRTLQFSLSRLLAVMLLLGLLLSAGMYASPNWKNALAIGMSLLLLNSVLRVYCRGGRDRAFWVGFAIFGWGLFGLTFAADEHVLAPRDWIMDVHSRIKRETLQQRPEYIPGTRPGEWVRAGTTVSRVETPSAGHFVDVVRWFIHLAVAVFGGCLAVLYEAKHQQSCKQDNQRKEAETE